MLITRLRRDERGASLVLVALTMVVLLGMTAFVVDLGQEYNERRLSQTSADGAVLGGIQHIGVSRAAATAQAMEVARANLRITYTDPEWTTLWASSSAPGNGCPSAAPSGYVFGPGTKCVMFNTANTRMRVRIPDQILDTAFGKVIGTNQLRTSAWAEAEIDLPGPGGVLPFGVISTGGDGQELCLKDGSGGHAIPPCDGPNSGNFGYLSSPLYGNAQYGTTAKCTGDENGRLVNNIIEGIDHLLDEFQGPSENPPEPTEALRSDSCYNTSPNEMFKKTGNIGQNLDDGLVRGTGSSGGPARLRRGPFQKVTVTPGYELDNKPLWEFIDPGLDVGNGIPASCVRSSFTGVNANKAHMNQCFAEYNALVNAGAAPPPIFTADSDPGDGVYDIQLSPRLNFVPEFWETSLGSGSSGSLTIKRFRAAFIQTVFFTCDGNSCDVVFNPGESCCGLPGAWNKSAESMSAFIFDNAMLPQSVVDTGPGGSLNGARIGLIG